MAYAMAEKKKNITIYHLHLFENEYNKDINPKDYYFGSISAIFEHFDKKQIGIQASSIYNFNLDENNPVYENKRCRIRKDILRSKMQSK